MMVMAKSPTLRATALQSREAIELLSDKWRIAVLHLLTRGALRTSELQRSMDEISPKMLTQTLRGMERDGLISRTVQPVSPPHVDYRLTQMGMSLIGPIRELCHWAKAHTADRDAARARFDAAAKRLHFPDPLRGAKPRR